MPNLKEYIEAVKKQVKEALGDDAKLAAPIALELTTTVDAKSAAGLNIQVIELGASISSQEIQKISINLTLASEADKMEDRVKKEKAEAAIATAQAEKAMSEQIKRQSSHM